MCLELAQLVQENPGLSLASLVKTQTKKAQQLLILAPNTELAGQLFDVTKTWAEPLNLTAQLFISGSSQKRQIERLKKGLKSSSERRAVFLNWLNSKKSK